MGAGRTMAGRLARGLALASLVLGLCLVGGGAWIHAKALVAQVLLDRAFDRSVRDGRPVQPWHGLDAVPVARLSLPRLGRSLIVLGADSGQALAFAPGQVPGTPAPGEEGTAVYAAHRDTHFAALGELRIGDAVEVTRADGAAFRFVVDGTRVVHWDTSGIDPASPGRRLVLTTCWPLDAVTSGPLRYVVSARLVDK
jgi:sortase A